MYVVGDVNQPSISTIGEAIFDVTIDGVLAAEYRIDLVDNDTITVDVMVRLSYLLLPHVNYYKNENELVF